MRSEERGPERQIREDREPARRRVPEDRPPAEERERSAQRPKSHREQGGLFKPEEADRFRSRWEAVQTGFVDDPRSAVVEASALVGELTDRLIDTFNREREGLERQWESGGEASTEDLRIALQRYRAFFGRLLSL